MELIVIIQWLFRGRGKKIINFNIYLLQQGQVFRGWLIYLKDAKATTDDLLLILKSIHLTMHSTDSFQSCVCRNAGWERSIGLKVLEQICCLFFKFFCLLQKPCLETLLNNVKQREAFTLSVINATILPCTWDHYYCSSIFLIPYCTHRSSYSVLQYATNCRYHV